MGFIDKLRAEFIDIIEWVDDSQRTLVWRFPRYQNEIKWGAQLIVRPGQVAIFVCHGKIADVFEPGQYRLETKNLPVLSTLLGWPYGFDSPFRSEVYFVRTTQLTDLKWGTPNPVMMRDADFGPIRIRAFGIYTLKAITPKTLLKELVGVNSAFDSEEIMELLRANIQAAFADAIASAGIPVLDLASNYADLAERVRLAAIERIDDEYGLDIPQLHIVNISLPAEVEKALDERTSMNVIGDMARYQQFQMGHAIPVAAANPAGGLAGAGVGLGMGMAMAGGLHTSGSPAPITPPPLLPAVWHFAENDQSVGPVTLQQLAEAHTAGRVTLATLVWTPGMSDWTLAAQVPQLASLFQTATAPPPPQSTQR